MAGTKQCSGNAVQVCGSNGQWGMTSACPNGQSCVSGACTTAVACMAGTTQCSGNAAQVCGSHGQKGNPPSCPHGPRFVSGGCTTPTTRISGPNASLC